MRERETPKKEPARQGSSERDRKSEVRELGRVRDAVRWLASLAPPTLPPGVQSGDGDGPSRSYTVGLGDDALGVCVEIISTGGKLWAHLAITWRTRPPTLAMLTWCRDVFLRGRGALWRLPRRNEFSHTLHIYAPLEGADLAPGVLEEFA